VRPPELPLAALMFTLEVDHVPPVAKELPLAVKPV
jgi:hypothetical protein